jgi:hypothetical protein
MNEPIRDDSVLDAIRVLAEWLPEVPNPALGDDDLHRRWEDRRAAAVATVHQLVFLRTAQLGSAKRLRAVR